MIRSSGTTGIPVVLETPLAELAGRPGALELLQHSAISPLTHLDGASLSVLARYVVDVHHEYTRRELASLLHLTRRVREGHVLRRAELTDVEEELEQLAAELRPHMLKEEQVLFPYFRQLDDAILTGRGAPRPIFGTAQNPIRMMQAEHELAGESLARLRSLTSGYALPVDACASLRRLYAGLAAFERDLMRHVFIENELLFPRAIAAEQALRAREQDCAALAPRSPLR